MDYDIIGDIHGHSRPLERLLHGLGYRVQGGAYRCDGRRAVFLGDFVDRGPEIREALAIVRTMVETGSALTVMGNHEYNAICFHTLRPDEPHRWLRSRTDRHIHQHIETIYQFRNHHSLWLDHLRWFATLPLFLDLGPIRVVHAAWHEPSLSILRRFSPEGNVLNDELLFRATRRGNEEFDAIQNVLKGVEVDLPDAATFVDKDGHERREMRVRWWENASGRTYDEIAVSANALGVTRTVSEVDAARITGYQDRVPVFIGHYWLQEPSPTILTPYVACLDYSVAKGGYLAAYRFRGERTLSNDHFVRHTDTGQD